MDKKTLEIQIKLLAEQALSQIKSFGTDIQNAAQKAKGFTGDSKNVAASIKSMQQEAQRAASQIKLFGGSSADLKDTTQKLKNTILDLVSGGLKPESAEIQNLVEKYRQLDGEVQKTEASEQGFLGIISSVKNEIGSLATAAAALKADKAVLSLAKSALSASTSFRAAKDEFGIMLGDMKAGAAFFEELQEFNYWTPFDIESTSQAAKVLMAAKVPLGEITDYLTRFGDISQGNAQRFQSFINAFSKASAKGKADMEVLNVYIDQGVQILDALAAQLGVTSSEITTMASKGEISFSTLDSALASMAAEGGQYYNTMATASQRLDSVYAGLVESTKALAASFGDMLAPAVSAVLSSITEVIDAINNSPLLKGAIAAALTAVVTLLNVKMITALVGVIAKIWSAYAAQMSLNAAMGALNPVVAAATAAVAIGVGVYTAYATSQQDSVKASDELALSVEKQSGAIQTLTKDIKNMSRETRDASVAQLELKRAAIEAQIQNVKSSMMTGSTQAGTVGVTTSIGNTVNKVFSGGNALQQAAAAAEEAAKKTESYRKELSELNKELDAVTAQIQAYNDVTAAEDAAAAEAAFNAELKATNDEIEHRNRLYSQTREGQLAALEAELEFARQLIGKKTLNEDGSYSGYDVAKTEAIIRNLEERIEKLKNQATSAAVAFTDEWTKKNLDGLAKIQAEEEESLNKLQEQALAALGEKYAESEEYERQLLALQTYYEKQRVEYQKRQEEERLSLVESWTEKNLDGIDRIKNEQAKAQKELDEVFSKLGGNWQNDDGYKTALIEMNKYFENLIEAEQSRNVFTDEWTRKNLDGLEKINVEEEDSIARLNAQALAALGERYTETEEYEAQLFALQTYYDNQREEYQKRLDDEEQRRQEERLSLVESWMEKNLDGIDRIKNEQAKAQKELEKVFSKLGEGWQDDDGYKTALAEMNKYYNNLIEAEQSRNVFTDEWTRKNLDGLEKINAERAESEQKLKELALASLGEEYEQAEAFQKELAALTTYYDKQVSDYRKKIMDEEASHRADFIDEWTHKDLDGVARIKRERMEAYVELANKAEKAFGEGWQDNEQYKAAQSAMMEHFSKELSEAYKSAADQERRAIMDAHSRRMQNIKEEAEYRMELARAETERARESGSFAETASAYAEYAGAAAESAISETQLGQMLAGADPITMLIDAFIEAAMAVESVNKILNFASTIIGSMMEVIEPMIDSIFAPIATLLEDIGQTLGTVLAPVLNALYAALSPVLAVVKLISGALQLFAKLFEWVNNKIIVPLGNAIINGVNAVIKLLNKIPGVEIELLDNLQLVGEAAQELAEEASRAAELTKKKYDRQRRAVEEQLDAQLDSIQAQYRLGLISREDYEAQAEKYQAAADGKLYDINVLMEEELARIEANTRAGLTSEQKEQAQAIAAGKVSYADQWSRDWGENLGTFGEIAGSVVGTVADIGKGIWDGIGGLFGWWDVGSTNIPHDQFGMVHQGEAIIPRTFADGVRNGDMAIVGGRNSQSNAAASPVYVTLNVGGSVVAENELVDTVYNGILHGIEHRKYAPLGA